MSEENRKIAVKVLSDFINTHEYRDVERQYLHMQLSYLEEKAVKFDWSLTKRLGKNG